MTLLVTPLVTTLLNASIGEDTDGIRMSSSLLDYMGIYRALTPVVGWMFLIASFGLLFLFLVTAAQQYFCTNLSSIATFLQLPETVSGVTIAALGNGATDLFSTFAAFRNDNVPLALGELFGAAAFITLVIVGAVCVLTPSKVPRRPFLRDSIALMGAILLTDSIVATGQLTLGSGLLLATYYFVYVSVVVLGSYYGHLQSIVEYLWPSLTPQSAPNVVRRRRTAPTIVDGIYSNHYGDDSGSVATSAKSHLTASEALDDRNDSILTISTEGQSILLQTSPDTFSPLPAASLLAEDDFDQDFFLPHLRVPLQRQLSSHRKAVMNKHGSIFLPPTSDETVIRDPSNGSHATETPLRHVFTSSTEQITNSQVGSSDLTLARIDASTALQDDTESQNIRRDSVGEDVLLSFPVDADNSLRQLVDQVVLPIVRRMLPFVYRWDTMSLSDKIMSILSSPVVFVMTLTVPVVIETYFCNQLNLYEPLSTSAEDGGDSVEESDTPESLAIIAWEKEAEELAPYLGIIQCFLLPLVACLALDLGSEFLLVSRLAVCVLAGSILSGLFMLLWRFGSQTTLFKVLSVVGFVASLLIMSKMSDELVVLIQVVGTVSGLDQTLMGLTLLALANSTSELITNLAIARMGYSAMALGACYGGTMLNIVLGLGFSTMLTSAANEGRPVVIHGHFDKSFWICSVSLSLSLLLNIVYVVWNKYNMDERLGVMNIVWYILTASVIVIYSLPVF